MKFVCNLKVLATSIGVMLCSLGFFPQSALAGIARVGNGGAIVVCSYPTDRLESVELFDFYRFRPLQEFPRHMNYKDVLEMVLARLHERHPDFASAIAGRLDEIGEVLVLSDMRKIEVLDDVNSLRIPEGCQFRQAANTFFRKGCLFEPIVTLIDREVWEVLTPVQKAGLLFHEALFIHLNESGDFMSYRIHKIVGAIFSRPFLTTSPQEFAWFLRLNSVNAGRVLPGVLETKRKICEASSVQPQCRFCQDL